jgi:hypothetical protein
MLMLFFYKSERSVWSSAAWFGRHMDMDETGIKRVQIYDRVIARRGCKYIQTLTSAEPGKLATSAQDVSAAGNTMSPCSIFPRIKFRAHFLNGVPAEIQGDGGHPGWMQAELFVKSVKYFFPHVKHLTSSSHLESHDSPLSVVAFDCCKEDGVTVLSFPPHFSHKLQPLDRRVCGPLNLCQSCR